jgi:hypothetical protein
MTLILVLGALLIASPSTRQAVAGWLGIGGVGVEVRPGTALASEQPNNPPVFADLRLGSPTTLAQARDAVEFEVLTTPEAPDAVYVKRLIPGGEISLVYSPGTQLPEIGHSDVGMIISEFEGEQSHLTINKLVFSGATVEPVAIGSDRGLWVKGAHIIQYLDRNGDYWAKRVRLSKSALLWQHGASSIRIEANISKAAAVLLALQMR